MAKAGITSWTACITELQRLVDAAAASRGGAKDNDIEAFNQRLKQLERQRPLPHAAWKRLVQDVQVTNKLTALYVRALQQADARSLMPLVACCALETWLRSAEDAAEASNGSRVAAMVRRQIHDAHLMQHLGAGMDAAATQLTALVAAAASTASRSSGSASSSSDAQQGSIYELARFATETDVYCNCLLKNFFVAGTLMTAAAEPLPSIHNMQSAAPAAARLITAVFQTHSQLQHLNQQQLFQPASSTIRECERALSITPAIVARLSAGITDGATGKLPSSPAANELLQSPELLSCLAIMAVVAVLGSDMTCDGGASTQPTAKPAPSSNRGMQSRTTRQLPRMHQQQQQAEQTASTNSGVRMDSLTTMSCGWFGVLGITKEAVLQAAMLAKRDRSSLLPLNFADLRTADTFLTLYKRVLKYQVKLSNGGVSAQLLMQLEADALLSLMLLQLAASIPNSYPDAQATHELGTRLGCNGLFRLWGVSGLHMLPWPTGHTGPQLALQLLPSPLMPQQQQPLSQQPQQETALYALALSASLLEELLPLLTRSCLQQVKQHQEKREQRHASPLPAGQLPRALPPAVYAFLQYLRNILVLSVVPVPGATAAAEGPPTATGGHCNGDVTYSCALHAECVLVRNARGIFSCFEAVARCEAETCIAAAATAVPVAGAGVVSTGIGAAAAPSSAGPSAHDGLECCADLLFSLCHHKVVGDYPHSVSPLVLLAQAAGPGSHGQRQFHSLLATMVKLCKWGMKGLLWDDMGLQYFSGAVSAASALLAGAADNRQQQPVGTAAGSASCCSSGDAVAMLPNIVILGRCCMQYADRLHACHSVLLQPQAQQPVGCPSQHMGAVAESPHHWLGFLVSSVQQFLTSISTCDELAAAGYAPQQLLQHVEQLTATCQALVTAQLTAADYLVTAHLFYSVGLALCSFAVPCMCNNPQCASMSGLSELASVSGHSCICAGCHVAHYCGRACQRVVWKQHKPVCAALAAAAAKAEGTC